MVKKKITCSSAGILFIISKHDQSCYGVRPNFLCTKIVLDTQVKFWQGLLTMRCFNGLVIMQSVFSKPWSCVFTLSRCLYVFTKMSHSPGHSWALFFTCVPVFAVCFCDGRRRRGLEAMVALLDWPIHSKRVPSVLSIGWMTLVTLPPI